MIEDKEEDEDTKVEIVVPKLATLCVDSLKKIHIHACDAC